MLNLTIKATDGSGDFFAYVAAPSDKSAGCRRAGRRAGRRRGRSAEMLAKTLA